MDAQAYGINMRDTLDMAEEEATARDKDYFFTVRLITEMDTEKIYKYVGML